VADERGIRTTILEMKTCYGEKIEWFYQHVTEAWNSLPPESQKTAWIDLTSLRIEYFKPLTEEDKRDIAEYERLKEKFKDTEYK